MMDTQVHATPPPDYSQSTQHPPFQQPIVHPPTPDTAKVLDVKESEPRGRSDSVNSELSTASIRTGSSGGHSEYKFDAEAPPTAPPPDVRIGFQHDPASDSLVMTPQLLHIYITTLSKKDLLITLDDKRTVLYTSSAHIFSSSFGSSSPDVELRRGGQTSPIIASAKLHKLSDSDIFLEKSKMRTTLSREKTFGVKYSSKCPTNGQIYTWKSTHAGTSFFSSGNLKLEGPDGQLLARFTSSAYKSVSKAGKLEILQPVNEFTLDWLMICCLAMIEKERRKKNAGRGAAVGGAASVG